VSIELFSFSKIQHPNVVKMSIGWQPVTRKPNKTVDRCRLKNGRFEEEKDSN